MGVGVHIHSLTASEPGIDLESTSSNEGVLHSKDSTRSREKNILATAKYSPGHWSNLEMNKSYLPSNAGIYILIFLILLLLHFNISDTGIYFLNVLCSLFLFGFLMIHMLSFIPTVLILIPITTLLAIPTL